MAQTESQPASGQPDGQRPPLRPDGRRRQIWRGRPDRHGQQDPPCPPRSARDEQLSSEGSWPDAAQTLAGGGAQEQAPVRLEHPVVAGYDGSPSSRHALAYAAGMARRLNRPLLIVHVCPAGVYCEPLTGQIVGAQRDRGELERWLIAEFDQIADRAGLTVWVLARRGSPARELAATADEQGADALVIGAPKHLWHQVTGSVPGWLARHAHCPVMVVP
jgi:nucleotide-binding universal stress UspA family protein